YSRSSFELPRPLMNIYSFLIDDHTHIKGLLDRLESLSTSPAEPKRAAFKKLRRAMDMHLYLEEVIFYPAIAASGDSKLKAIMTEENNAIKILLEQLADCFKNRKNYAAELTLLVQKVDHHIEEQEGPIFGKARVIFGPEEAEKLGLAIEDERAIMRSDRKFEIEVF